MTAMRRHLSIAALVLLLASPVQADQRSDGAASPGTLISRAERGDAEAQFRLGLRYSEGDGVTRDSGRALHWLRLAADQGFEAARFLLANDYSETCLTE